MVKEILPLKEIFLSMYSSKCWATKFMIKHLGCWWELVDKLLLDRNHLVYITSQYSKISLTWLITRDVVANMTQCLKKV